MFQKLNVVFRLGPVSNELDIARDQFDCFAGFLAAKIELLFKLLWRLCDGEIRFELLFAVLKVELFCIPK